MASTISLQNFPHYVYTDGIYICSNTFSRKLGKMIINEVNGQAYNFSFRQYYHFHLPWNYFWEITVPIVPVHLFMPGVMCMRTLSVERISEISVTYALTCVEWCEVVILIAENMFASKLYRHLPYDWERFRNVDDVNIMRPFYDLMIAAWYNSNEKVILQCN